MADDEEMRILWVGHLSSQVTEEILYELFLQAGPLEKVCIAKDKDGKQRTFGFVTYVHAVSVPYAVAIFEGTELFHKEIRLNSTNKTRYDIEALRRKFGIPPQSLLQIPPPLLRIPLQQIPIPLEKLQLQQQCFNRFPNGPDAARAAERITFFNDRARQCNEMPRLNSERVKRIEAGMRFNERPLFRNELVQQTRDRTAHRSDRDMRPPHNFERENIQHDRENCNSGHRSQVEERRESRERKICSSDGRRRSTDEKSSSERKDTSTGRKRRSSSKRRSNGPRKSGDKRHGSGDRIPRSREKSEERKNRSSGGKSRANERKSRSSERKSRSDQESGMPEQKLRGNETDGNELEKSDEERGETGKESVICQEKEDPSRNQCPSSENQSPPIASDASNPASTSTEITQVLAQVALSRQLSDPACPPDRTTVALVPRPATSPRQIEPVADPTAGSSPSAERPSDATGAGAKALPWPGTGPASPPPTPDPRAGDFCASPIEKEPPPQPPPPSSCAPAT